jgi:hypothetical protein
METLSNELVNITAKRFAQQLEISDHAVHYMTLEQFHTEMWTMLYRLKTEILTQQLAPQVIPVTITQMVDVPHYRQFRRDVPCRTLSNFWWLLRNKQNRMKYRTAHSKTRDYRDTTKVTITGSTTIEREVIYPEAHVVLPQSKWGTPVYRETIYRG